MATGSGQNPAARVRCLVLWVVVQPQDSCRVVKKVGLGERCDAQTQVRSSVNCQVIIIVTVMW